MNKAFVLRKLHYREAGQERETHNSKKWQMDWMLHLSFLDFFSLSLPRSELSCYKVMARSRWKRYRKKRSKEGRKKKARM